MPLTRIRLLLALTVAVGVAVGASTAPPPDAARAATWQPNVVVIMTDDQTYVDMAAMPQTRRLIGAAGTTFTRAYVSYPVCCPSRATFLTGQYAHNHGVRTNTPPDGGVEALDAEHTLPVWLRAAGYDTSHVGKYLNGYGMRRRARVPPGWSDWHGSVDKSTYQMYGYTLFENGEARTYGDFHVEDPAVYQTDVFRDKALQVIEAHAGSTRPFLLSLAFVAPHGEVLRPGGTTEPYVRPAPRHAGQLAGSEPPPIPAFDERDVRDKPPAIRRLSRLSPGARERISSDFQARQESLLAVDEAVAAVVETLGRTGQLDSTYIVFTSDNGFFQGEHRIAKGKYFPYEAATHVPLLIRGPGIPAGGVSGELVSNADLAPTVLDAAGAVADRPLDGRSLLPFARDPGLQTHRPILHEGLVGGDNDRDRPGGRIVSGLRTYYAIRTQHYLYVKWRGGPRELYDLAADPYELESLHRDPRYAAVKQALSTEVARLRRCAGATCLADIPQFGLARRTAG